MSDIAAVVSIVSSMVTTISSSVSDVKFNKHVCGQLARKCEWLEDQLKNGDLGSPTNPALKQLVRVLMVCEKDLKKFASFGLLMRIIRSGGIPKICKAHIEELDEWVKRIKDTTSARDAPSHVSPVEAGNEEEESDDDDDDGDESENRNANENDDEDNEDNMEAMGYDTRVSENQDHAREALLSESVPRQLRRRADLNPDYLQFERQPVGTFSFGTIYRGTYNGEAVYIRELRNDIPRTIVANIRAGIILAQCLSDCEKIVRVYGICGDRKIVTAVSANGPLSEYTEKLTVLQKVAIARMVADALVFMHDIQEKREGKRVLHRDIRASNILLTEKLEPVLTGFEMCKLDGELTKDRPDIEQSLKKWWPPERLCDCGTYPASDVYSFGVLLFEISTGKEPKPEDDKDDLVALERDSISERYSTLMESCLEGHGNARPKMDKIVEELLEIEADLEPAGPFLRMMREE
ncbi:hypothetical protein EMPS_09848 [Entomortierella parvispora]|uniref:Protein kinase domain-containing protein n=1 Tax=Entomortierella parvispora TaxID=205924 RepID=A0A9P3HIS8_9FUNG|nr:hypothetical protein EMPS_09848 [Entomortierella parvispora]